MNLKKVWDENKIVLPLGIVTGIVVLIVTLVVYLGFAANLISGHEAMSPEVRAMISRDQINIGAQIVANIAYGYLLVLIFKWGRIYKPLHGAIAGVVVAVLSDLYYALALYSTSTIFTITSIAIDAAVYAVINFIVGALLAWFLGKTMSLKER